MATGAYHALSANSNPGNLAPRAVPLARLARSSRVLGNHSVRDARLGFTKITMGLLAAKPSQPALSAPSASLLLRRFQTQFVVGGRRVQLANFK